MLNENQLAEARWLSPLFRKSWLLFGPEVSSNGGRWPAVFNVEGKRQLFGFISLPILQKRLLRKADWGQDKNVKEFRKFNLFIWSLT